MNAFIPSRLLTDSQRVTKVGHLALQNGPFRTAKRSVSQAKTDRFASSNGPYCFRVKKIRIYRSYLQQKHHDSGEERKGIINC